MQKEILYRKVRETSSNKLQSSLEQENKTNYPSKTGRKNIQASWNSICKFPEVVNFAFLLCYFRNSEKPRVIVMNNKNQLN